MTVIAKRTLERVKDGKRTKVTVSIHQPVQRRTGEWSCAVAITGLGRRISNRAHGEDAFQALILGHQLIRILLDASKEKLNWLGLPMSVAFPTSMELMLDVGMTKRIEAHMRREMRAWGKALRKLDGRGRAG